MSYRCFSNGKTSCYVTSVESGVTSPCKAMLSTAVEEKQEMKSLNDQLACLVSRVRSARQCSSSFDASSYRETISSLEEELVRVKNLYECEMSKLRQRLDEAGSCKASTSAMYESSIAQVSELKSKMAAEISHSEKLATELSCAKSEMMVVKKQLCDLSLTLQCTQSELEKATSVCHAGQEFEETKCRLQQEICRRAEMEETIKSLREKLCFETRLREQNRCELEERLRSSTDVIRTLEVKLKEVNAEPDFDFTAVLAKLRAGTACELERYKAETDEALNRNLYALRQQIESEKSVRVGLTTEKSRMEQIIAELRTRIADSEGQMAGLIKQRDALETTLRSERSRATGQIRDLEIKLGELNDVMLSKVKECTNAREAQVSLKTEIDAFKVLLQEGEKRMTAPCTTTTKLVDYDTTLGLSHCLPSTVVVDTDVYITPRPPPTPRRRPTSAHASCYQSKTRIAPVDDRVFHCHANTEYRTSAGSGTCALNSGSSKYRYTSIDDLDLHKSYNTSGKRVSLEFQPDAIKRVNIKDDFEVCGKGISTCFAPSFPKRSQNWGERYSNKKGTVRPRSGRPRTVYHDECHTVY